MNFSLPFSGTVTPNWITTVNPIENHVTAVNNLLYSPEGHQAVDNSPLNQQQQQQQFYRNDPYAAPTQSPDYQSEQYHYRSRNHYLPPLLSTLNQKNQNQQLSPVQQRTISNYQSHQQTQTQYDESRYETHDYFNANIQFNSSNVNSETIPYDLPDLPDSQLPNDNRAKNTNAFPVNPPQYTQVQAGHGSNTQVHAVLDYDNDEYYDQENVGKNRAQEFVFSFQFFPVFCSFVCFRLFNSNEILFFHLKYQRKLLSNSSHAMYSYRLHFTDKTLCKFCNIIFSYCCLNDKCNYNGKKHAKLIRYSC